MLQMLKDPDRDFVLELGLFEILAIQVVNIRFQLINKHAPRTWFIYQYFGVECTIYITFIST